MKGCMGNTWLRLQWLPLSHQLKANSTTFAAVWWMGQLYTKVIFYSVAKV